MPCWWVFTTRALGFLGFDDLGFVEASLAGSFDLDTVSVSTPAPSAMAVLSLLAFDCDVSPASLESC